MKTLMLAAWLTGTGADAVSTHIALNRGAREIVMSQNPIVNDCVVVGAEGVGGAFLLARLHRTHPKTAIVFGIFAGAGRSYIAYRNFQTVSGLPRTIR
jgi:hypothetical protein